MPPHSATLFRTTLWLAPGFHSLARFGLRCCVAATDPTGISLRRGVAAGGLDLTWMDLRYGGAATGLSLAALQVLPQRGLEPFGFGLR